MKLSIIVPTIRPHNLRALYESTAKAINGRYPWEMVAIGPDDAAPPGNRLWEHSWQFLQDDGSPCHCQQRALLHCRGEYVTWAADDGIWIPGSLDRDWDDDAILCKYMEAKPDLNDPRWDALDAKTRHDVMVYARGDVGLNPDMVSLDRFWTIGYHQVDREAVKWLSSETWCLCLGIIKRSVLLDVGGWNEDYETTGRATVDLGLRLQKAGVKFVVWQHIVQALGYEPKSECAMKAAYEGDMVKYKRYWASADAAARLPIRPDAMQPGQPWARRVK